MKSKIVILFIAFSLIAYGQTPTTGELEMEIESLAEGNEENETDLMQLAEKLDRLRNNPVEINFATLEEIQEIPYLNIFQIANLLQYRKSTGIIYAPFELMAVKGFSRPLIEKMLPYISFAPQKTVPDIRLKNVWKYSRHDIILRSSQVLQQRKGFVDSIENGYLGSPQNLYLRYKMAYRDYISIGFIAQQDPGEPFGGEYQNGPVDFFAGHIALENYGNVKSLILGDYQAQFGQGMTFWSSLAFGKSARAFEIKRYARGFSPYAGSEENRFLRGGAITYRLFDRLDISAFYSKNKIDANREVPDSLNTVEMVSSLQLTGLHRTINELTDKDANVLQTLGGNINLKINNFSLGLTAVNYQLQYPLEEGDQLYEKFRFAGKSRTNMGADFNYLFRHLNIFGELSSDDSSNLAGGIGFQSNPADGFYFSIHYRNISKEYTALFNAPFGESGSYGEKGTYFGVEWQLNRTFLLKSFVDIYRFDWLRFGIDAPSKGRDIMAQLETYFTRNFNGYIRMKNEVQQTNSINETAITKLTERRKTSLRLHTSYSLSRNIKMASRLEYAFYDQELQKSKGFLLFQDLKYHFAKFPLKLTGRFALTDVDDYDARIYAYENDLTYSFSIPPYYGKSSRFYLMADYDITTSIGFQAKYAITTFYDREEISTGLNLIEGNKISELKLQLHVKF